MARDRLIYEDVMDVKLRGTLKELGFERKSPSSYIRERPKVTRVFELHTSKWGDGFHDAAGVMNHEMHRIYEDVLGDDFVHYAGMRNLCTADTSIVGRIRAEVVGGPTCMFDGFVPGYSKSVAHLLEFNEEHMWLPGKNPRGVYDPEELDRIYFERIAGFGPYLDEMFRRYLLPWYELCDDPAAFAQWYEDHVWPGLPKMLGAIVAHHLAGNNRRAEELIVKLLKQGAMSYEEVLRDIQVDNKIRGWMHWPVLRSLFRPEKFEDQARSWFRGHQIAATKARRLADAFGIKV